MSEPKSSSGSSDKDILIVLDDLDEQWLRIVASYEAIVRSRRIGQVFCELVYEAIDPDSYPDELKREIARIDRDIARDAVMRARAAVGLLHHHAFAQDR